MLVRNQVESSPVVLPHGSGNDCSHSGELEVHHEFFDQHLEANELLHCSAKCLVLCVKSAEADSSHESGLPYHGNSTKQDDVTTSGSCAVDVAGIFISKQASEAGINLADEVKFSGELDNHSFVLSSLEVPDDLFDCRCIGLLGVLVVSCHLAYYISDVWPCVA
jgi:hypothetical protein